MIGYDHRHLRVASAIAVTFLKIFKQLNFFPVPSLFLCSMKSIAENIKDYVNAWNETTPEGIKAGFKKCCTPGVTYTDKNTPKFSGINQLAELVMSAHDKFPGIRFSVLSEPEYFEGQAYYAWGVHFPETGDRAGRDFMEYDDNHLIKRIVGFLPVA